MQLAMKSLVYSLRDATYYRDQHANPIWKSIIGLEKSSLLSFKTKKFSNQVNLEKTNL